VTVLFDIDGTLIDGAGAGRRAFESAAGEILGRADILRRIRFDGMTDRSIARAAIEAVRPGVAASQDEISRLIEGYLSRVGPEVEASPRYRVLPGVRELLVRLSASQAVVGLCTGNVERGARTKLARGDLNQFFAFGGFGDDGEDREHVVRVALSRAEAHAKRTIEPREVWVVGDTPRDLDAGRACGTRVLLVASGWHPFAELVSLGADQCVETLADPSVFETLLPRA
jgi:phosphoglycolate phosphatase